MASIVVLFLIIFIPIFIIFFIPVFFVATVFIISQLLIGFIIGVIGLFMACINKNDTVNGVTVSKLRKVLAIIFCCIGVASMIGAAFFIYFFIVK